MNITIQNRLNLVDKMQLASVNYEKYVTAAMSQNTRIAYQSDLRRYIDWGGTIPGSPQMICMYLSYHADQLQPGTLSRHLVAIKRAHTTQDLPSPTNTDLVKATLRGIRRVRGSKLRQAAPILKTNLVDMVARLSGIKGCRDRALLMIGFAGALRRSELVGLNHNDIEFVEHGLILYINRSKTDQEGYGRKVAIPYAKGITCPVTALKQWLEVSGINEGPLFRPVNKHGRIAHTALSTQAIAIIVKDKAAAVGFDPSKYSGHSLRAGLVTSAAQAGVSNWKIKQQTGHKSDAMLNTYIRDARLFIDNAAGAIL